VTRESATTRATFLVNVIGRTYLLFHSRFIRYTSRFALCPPGRYAQRKAIPRRNLIKTIKLWKETSAEPSRSPGEKEKDKKRENKSTRLEARIRFSSPTFIFARFPPNPRSLLLLPVSYPRPPPSPAVLCPPSVLFPSRRLNPFALALFPFGAPIFAARFAGDNNSTAKPFTRLTSPRADPANDLRQRDNETGIVSVRSNEPLRASRVFAYLE